LVGAALAAALWATLSAPPAAAKDAADCAQKRKDLTKARKQADRLRIELRKLLLAGGDAGQAKIDEVQTKLMKVDAEVDQLAEAVKGCPAAPRAKKPKKKALKEKAEPPKTAAPEPPRSPPAPPPTPPSASPGAPGSPRVVLTPDRIRSGTLPPASCAEQALQAHSPSFEHEGRPGAVPGAFAAWNDRQKRHDHARRVGKRARELLEQCQQEGGGAP
jgi:outer membrane murein-binding lipoprotein Lpp